MAEFNTPPHLSDETLAALAEGHMDGAEGAQAAAHVEGCPHCQAELAQFQSLMAEFRSLPVQVAPPGFTERVMGEVEKLEARWWRLPFWRSLLNPRRPQGMVVALLGVAVALFVLRTPEMEETAKQVGVPSAEPISQEEIPVRSAPLQGVVEADRAREERKVAPPPPAVGRRSNSLVPSERDAAPASEKKKETALLLDKFQAPAKVVPSSGLDMAQDLQGSDDLDRLASGLKGSGSGGGGIGQNSLGGGGLVQREGGNSSGAATSGFAYAPSPPADVGQLGDDGIMADGPARQAEPSATKPAAPSGNVASRGQLTSKDEKVEAELAEEVLAADKRKWPAVKTAARSSSSEANEQPVTTTAASAAAPAPQLDAAGDTGRADTAGATKENKRDQAILRYEMVSPVDLAPLMAELDQHVRQSGGQWIHKLDDGAQSGELLLTTTNANTLDKLLKKYGALRVGKVEADGVRVTVLIRLGVPSAAEPAPQ